MYALALATWVPAPLVAEVHRGGLSRSFLSVLGMTLGNQTQDHNVKKKMKPI